MQIERKAVGNDYDFGLVFPQNGTMEPSQRANPLSDRRMTNRSVNKAQYRSSDDDEELF